MTWRYMLIQKSDRNTEWVELHEVYHIDGRVSRTADPILVAGDMEEMMSTLSLMRISICKFGVEADPIPGKEEQ